MEEKKNNGLIVGVIILSLLVVGLSGYIVYDKLLKNDNIKETQVDNNKSNQSYDNTKLTESEALAIGKEAYNNLYKYMHSFVDPLGLDKSEYNEKDVYKSFYYIRENFVSEFYNIFSKNIKLNDVYNEYDDSSKTYKRNFTCEHPETDNMCAPNYNYIKMNDKYYVDSGCRAEGGRRDADEFKVEKIENNKIIYSYKLFTPENLWTWSLPDEKTKAKEEYKEYYDNLPLKTLEIIKEDNTWKINKASVPARCDWFITINN